MLFFFPDLLNEIFHPKAREFRRLKGYPAFLLDPRLMDLEDIELKGSALDFKLLMRWARIKSFWTGLAIGLATGMGAVVYLLWVGAVL